MHIGNGTMNPSDLFLLLGLIIVIITMFRVWSHRQRKSRQQQSQRERRRQAAQEAEQKTQMLSNLPKAKGTASDFMGTPFAGAIQGSAARWEAEIHQLGRQIMGQIDSKMSALQAITLEANRTANRLEILVEHLEHFAQTQVQGVPRPGSRQSEVIPATASSSQAALFAEGLEEFADARTDIRTIIKQSTAFTEQPQQATVLRLAELEQSGLIDGGSSSLRSEAAMLANYGLDSSEIARRLNISQGEVDIMLQVQQSR